VAFQHIPRDLLWSVCVAEFSKIISCYSYIGAHFWQVGKFNTGAFEYAAAAREILYEFLS
jgi:hypothetical protein